ncbi:GEM-like protein 4 [Gastrolobium bilobum]|uniref:GEM-like protein 4 n=1 Tax=Gastrolobium bilobum TaxID=150636 RepID=UPI002AB1DAD2|nr:GEM-like protein 4 [Gastrolobium bilobum]
MNTSLLHSLIIGTPVSLATYNQLQKLFNRCLPDPATSSKQSRVYSVINKIGRKADRLSQGVKEHVKMGPTITGTVMGKLSLGARILQVGGVEKIFNQYFTVRKGERLLKASQCYLSTTSGPLAGLLFISTEKVSFCSERSIKAYSPNGEMCRIRYKVAIPLEKIKCVNQSQNVQKQTQKYIEIVTEDNFEFWFMGFLKYQKTFKYLEQAISQA